MTGPGEPREPTLPWSPGYSPTVGCDLGWWPLIRDLAARLDVTCPGWGVFQVKEKFGGLRFYVHLGEASGDAAGRGWRAVQEAEAASFEICEQCGQPGILRDGAWLKTLCDNHSMGKSSDGR
jgi:hypothetical protein